MICIDIGNTDTVFAIFEGDQILETLRLRSNATEGKVFYAFHLQNLILEKSTPSNLLNYGVFSSVVPDMNDCIAELLSDFTAGNFHQIIPEILPLHKVLIENPQELGADLYANGVAAFRRFQTAVVIVDFGTALTFTAVSKEGSILGVAIAPGIGTAIKSLFSQTAQLPEVPLEMPASVIGDNTIKSIQSGILHGYEGMVKNLIGKFKEELGSETKVVATGGLFKSIESLSSLFDHQDINLTLTGIRLIGEELRDKNL